MISERVSLDDFVRLKRGYDLPERSRRPGGIPVLGSFGVTGDHDTPKHDGPGVTIGRSGASIGVATYCEGPYWPLNTALYVQDFKGNDPRFVYFVLDSIDFRSHNSGAAQPSLNRNYLGSIEVWRPELAVQKGVARVLGTIDDLITNNSERIYILERMARLTYREWFVDYRFPGHENIRFTDSSVGLIPAGWQVVPASTALLVNPAEKVAAAEQHAFITMGDVSETSMVCTWSERKSGSSGSKFRNGDTLFARITPCLENGKTGFVACLEEGKVGRGSTEFIVLRGQLVGPEFTYLLARTDEFREHAIKSMSGATGRQRVRNDCFDSHLIAVPPTDVERRFAETMRPMFRKVHSLSREQDALRQVRNLLLPRVVSGELDVSDIAPDSNAWCNGWLRVSRRTRSSSSRRCDCCAISVGTSRLASTKYSARPEPSAATHRPKSFSVTVCARRCFASTPACLTTRSTRRWRSSPRGAPPWIECGQTERSIASSAMA